MARGRPKKESYEVSAQEVLNKPQTTIGIASSSFKPHPDSATQTVAYDFSIHLIPKERWEANGITKESTMEFIEKSFENCKKELIKAVFE